MYMLTDTIKKAGLCSSQGHHIKPNLRAIPQPLLAPLFLCFPGAWENIFPNLIKSNRNQIVFTIFRLIWNQTNVCLDPNLWENGEYNLISGWFNKIQKIFLSVYAFETLYFTEALCFYVSESWGPNFSLWYTSNYLIIEYHIDVKSKH